VNRSGTKDGRDIFFKNTIEALSFNKRSKQELQLRGYKILNLNRLREKE
jgi:hypothetical protein